jgi:exopolyphosphatase/guanosine-5'-triphosphate,3'-diphosphate pyrophosphatase
MIIASIDIGTNTVLLLIAEVDDSTRNIIPLHNEYQMPRIGQDTKQTGIISNERLKLLDNVLKEYSNIIKSYSCDIVILTGTNAFRMASNTNEIIKEIKKSFNYDLKVISGEEEAEYAYFGAISNLHNPDNSMVIDIGGSSTEIIYGKSYNILYKNSFQLGSVTGTEQFLKHSPPLKFEIENFKREIKKLFPAFDKTIIPKKVIGIAGTATTLACMKLGLKEFDEKKVDKLILSIQDMGSIIEELSSLSATEILTQFGSVLNGREDIIFAGAFILQQSMEYFGIDRIIVGTRGIRYGAIVKYLESSI